MLIASPRVYAQSAELQTGRILLTVYTQADRPLEGVVAQSGTTTARSDAAGRATLHLPPGQHTIVATRIGFHPDSVRVNVSANRDTAVTITLTPQTTELSEVIIVSSTRTGRRIEDEPVRVEVLVREEIEEKLLMTPGDITMLLNETPGIRVQTTSSTLGSSSPRIRGLSGRYTQMLSDGLPLYGGQTAGLGLLQIPPMDLGGVEVIKGASSALYGSSALGGVINLLSRRPHEEPERELLINQTFYGGTDLVSFLSTTNEKRLGYTLLAGLHRQNEVDRDRDGWIDIPGYNRVLLRPRAFFEDEKGNTAMFTLGFMKEKREGGTLPGFEDPGGSPSPEILNTTSIDGGATASLSLSGSAALNVRASASVQKHNHNFLAEQTDTRSTWFGEVAYTWKGQSVSWVLGAALQNEEFDAFDLQPIINPLDPNRFDLTNNTRGIFAHGLLDVTAWLSAAASVRYDRHNRFGSFVSPRASLLLRPFEGWSIRAAAGTGYYPTGTLTEELESARREFVHVLTALKAERAVSGSLDLGGSLGPIELNASVFAAQVRNPTNVITIRLDDEEVFVGNEREPLRTHGAELLLRTHPEPFHVTASYTFVRSTEWDELNDARRESPLTPRHQAGLVVMWEREGDARIGTEVYFTSAQSLIDDSYRTRSKPYTHVGILAERRFGRVRAFVNAENLLDYRQTKYDPLVRPEPGPAGKWTNDAWAPLDGRVANAGVRISLR